jgi:hypothetical protein
MTRATALPHLGRLRKIGKTLTKQAFQSVWTTWTFSDFLDFVRCGLVRTFGRASLEASNPSNPGIVQEQTATCGSVFGYLPLDQQEDGNQQLGRLGHIVLTIEERGRQFAGKLDEVVRRIARTYRYRAVVKKPLSPRSLIAAAAQIFRRQGWAIGHG